MSDDKEKYEKPAMNDVNGEELENGDLEKANGGIFHDPNLAQKCLQGGNPENNAWAG